MGHINVTSQEGRNSPVPDEDRGALGTSPLRCSGEDIGLDTAEEVEVSNNEAPWRGVSSAVQTLGVNGCVSTPMCG